MRSPHCLQRNEVDGLIEVDVSSLGFVAAACMARCDLQGVCRAVDEDPLDVRVFVGEELAQPIGLAAAETIAQATRSPTSRACRSHRAASARAASHRAAPRLRAARRRARRGGTRPRERAVRARVARRDAGRAQNPAARPPPTGLAGGALGIEDRQRGLRYRRAAAPEPVAAHDPAVVTPGTTSIRSTGDSRRIRDLRCSRHSRRRPRRSSRRTRSRRSTSPA